MKRFGALGDFVAVGWQRNWPGFGRGCVDAWASLRFGKAMAGDMRAQEQCRRLLVELGRIRGIEAAAAVSFPALPIDDDDDPDDDGLDDLQRWRLERAAKYEQA
jgi:hypothetical protein